MIQNRAGLGPRRRSLRRLGRGKTSRGLAYCLWVRVGFGLWSHTAAGGLRAVSRAPRQPAVSPLGLGGHGKGVNDRRRAMEGVIRSGQALQGIVELGGKDLVRPILGLQIDIVVGRPKRAGSLVRLAAQSGDVNPSLAFKLLGDCLAQRFQTELDPAHRTVAILKF
jgi:hypothetical protein